MMCEATPEMIERGAAEMWRMIYAVGAEVKPFNSLHRFTQDQFRREAKMIWDAMTKENG